MSCNICQTKFSFFTREVGCPGCGFSYCSKCLKYKSHIPDVGVKKVCGRCFHKSKTVEKTTEKSSPTVQNIMDEPPEEPPLVPVDFIKKLDSLENPPKPSIVMYKHNSHWDKLKKGLEPADQEIVDRLRKLKEEEKQAPSEDDIKRRLALLKDEDPEANSSNHKIHHPSPRANINDDVDYDEENVTKRLLARALAEAVLEKKYEEDGMGKMEIGDPPKDWDDEDLEADDDDEDKPACVICDKTRNVKPCKCCSGDYYCPKCYAEVHSD